MTAIRYKLHFPLLICAAVVFWFVRDLRLPYWISDFNFLPYILMGSLYAAATVISLRQLREVRPISAAAFMVLAIFWSSATPLLALWTSIVWYPIVNVLPVGEPRFVVLFVHGSIVGSLGYWLLVRKFWLKSLRRADLLKSVLLCSAATAVFGIAPSASGDAADFGAFLLTPVWWLAFSLSLYWGEKTRDRKFATEAARS